MTNESESGEGIAIIEGMDLLTDDKIKFVKMFNDFLYVACLHWGVLPAELWGQLKQRKRRQAHARMYIIQELRRSVRYKGDMAGRWSFVFSGDPGYGTAKPLSLKMACGSVGLDHSAYLANLRNRQARKDKP